MNYQPWIFAFNVFQFLLSSALGIYVWWSNREKVTAARFQQLEKEVAERVSRADLKAASLQRDEQCAAHMREFKALEQANNALRLEVGKLPDRKEVKELSDSMRVLTEKIGNLGGRMDGVNRAVDLINEFLIEQGGKK